MLRKHIWLPILLLSAALLLVACPQPAPAAPEEAAQPAAPAAAEEGPCAPATEGALAGIDPRGQNIVWWYNHGGSREEKLLPLIDQFNQSNECSITVEGQNQGSYNDIRDKVNASIAAGEQPAALLVGYQNDQAFYQLNEALVDLNTFVNDPTWGLSEEEQADFYSSFFNQSIHPAFDNQRLGFPPNRSMEVIVYNQTWLEELGFDGPPETPEEFREMACAAAEANGDGTGGFILSDDASSLAAWTFALGGNVLNEEGTGYVYNSPATVEAMTLLKGMFDDGCAFLFTEGYPNPEFGARHAIFTQDSTSAIPFYAEAVDTIAEEESREPDEWGVAATPHTTADPVQNIYGGDVMITSTTPEQELAAWIFVKWFTSPEIQAQWDQISGYFPTRAATTEYLGDYVDQNKQWGQGLALLPYAYYEPQLVSYQTVRDATSKAVNEILQGADVQTALDELTTYANEAQEELMAEIE